MAVNIAQELPCCSESTCASLATNRPMLRGVQEDQRCYDPSPAAEELEHTEMKEPRHIPGGVGSLLVATALHRQHPHLGHSSSPPRDNPAPSAAARAIATCHGSKNHRRLPKKKCHVKTTAATCVILQPSLDFCHGFLQWSHAGL